MTSLRQDLTCGILEITGASIAAARGQWLITALLVPIIIFTLRPLWRITSRRVELSVSLVQAAETEDSAEGARRAVHTNGGLRAPHTSPEDQS